MRRFQRILLHLPDGECSLSDLQVAADRARLNGAGLTLFSTVDEPSRLRQVLFPGDSAEEIVAEQTAERNAQLAALADQIDVEADWRVEPGNAAVRVVQHVLRHEYDLVITVDDEARSSSDARRLVRKCPCPVWVIRPGFEWSKSGMRAVAAINPAPEELDLNIMILELASSMVERAGGELLVVHAWETVGSATSSGRTYSGKFGLSYDEMLVAARARRADALDEVLAQLKPFPIERRVLLEHGSAEASIMRVVDEERADLLVMGTVGRAGVNGLLIGNTAERVLSQASCGLLAVKPADFVSPIRVDE